jgi:hypothetical protein
MKQSCPISYDGPFITRIFIKQENGLANCMADVQTILLDVASNWVRQKLLSKPISEIYQLFASNRKFLPVLNNTAFSDNGYNVLS